jgi:signal transduction histidine kinase
MKRIEEYFLPEGSFTNEKIKRDNKLLIKFNLISILFAFGYFINTYFTGFILARYTVVIASILFVILLFCFKYRVISIKTAAAIFALICWLIVFSLSFFSGGIHSFVLPWVSLIPIIGLLLSGGKSAWAWGIIGFITVIFFINFNVDEHVPAHLMMQQNDILIASLLIGLLFLILTLTYIFEKQQTDLIIQIEKSNKQLQEAQHIIEQQNQQLLKKNEGLEIEIADRTKELVDYNQQLEQFAFIASHNLRAPIARIMGLGNILKSSNDPEDARFIKQNLIEAAIELDEIVKDINTILDIRKNKNAFNSNINVREEVEMILSNLQQESVNAQAKINVDIEPNYAIQSVRPYFNSIVYNLLNNAIKYRNPNIPPDIEVEIKQVEDKARIVVKDNGLGMDLKNSRNKIFTLYSRFHQHIEGKGIGLYLVKTQAEALGGKVAVESTPGIGTTFTVFIKNNSILM